MAAAALSQTASWHGVLSAPRDNRVRYRLPRTFRRVAHEPHPRSTFSSVPRSTRHIKVRTKTMPIVNLDVGRLARDDLCRLPCETDFWPRRPARIRETVAATCIRSLNAFSRQVVSNTAVLTPRSMECILFPLATPDQPQRSDHDTERHGIRSSPSVKSPFLVPLEFRQSRTCCVKV